MVKIAAPIGPEWIAAAERAAKMLKRGYQATRTAEGVYQVRSASQPDTVHTIHIQNVGMLQATCDCPHGRREGAKGHCWHIASALCAETRRVSRGVPSGRGPLGCPSRPQVSREETARFMARFAKA